MSFFCWLAVLILGRTPAPQFEAAAAVLRYAMRLQAYFLMLTAAYPKRIFGDRAPTGVTGMAAVAPGRGSATHPLLLTSGARVLLAVFILGGCSASPCQAGSGSSNSQGTTAQHAQP